MFVNRRVILFVLLQLSIGTATAAMEAVTEDGRRVRLLDDQTWEFIETDSAGTSGAKITIEVVRKAQNRGDCVFGLRLQNNSDFEIISLVPQFTAHVKDDVKYENVFVGFQRIKPTRHQYQELKFERIKCSEMTRISVHGGDRCAMGEMTKYSQDRGECLRQVDILPSPLVVITK